MSARDGGPAFPVECTYLDGEIRGRQTGNYTGFHEGMTLRDYFAAKAMAAIIIGNNADLAALTVGAAQDAYAMADAMLEARES